MRTIASLCMAFATLIAPSINAQEVRPIRIVVFGDSLSAGFLIPGSSAFPAVLEDALRQRGFDVVVKNESISGNTVADGLARLERDVPEGTDGVVLELGANDKLKQRDPRDAEAALGEIVRKLKARRISVLVVGIRFADAVGAPYNGIFASVASRYRVAYYPDIYAGLASNSKLTIFDNIHPSPEGVVVMVKRILPTVERFVMGLTGAPVRN